MSHTHLPHDHGHDLDNIALALPKVEEFQTISELFRQLSDVTRMRIFWILCHCEECVMNISALMEMSSPAVSHHLKLLKSAGLIVSLREGKEVYYTAAQSAEAQKLHEMIEIFIEITCPDK